MTAISPPELVSVIPRISLLDDEREVADGVARDLRRRGFSVTMLQPATPELQDTVRDIMQHSDAALCDHALRGGMRVRFSGADVVAALHDLNFPAVLFTGVQPEDRYSIRRDMARIPGFLHRDHDEGLGAERILKELAETVQEVRGGPLPRRRRARRTPVTVTSTRMTGGQTLVSLLVSGWPGGNEVEAPAELLAAPWSDRPRDAVGRTFFARVNLGEEDEQKLFFDDFDSRPAQTDRFIGLAE